MADKGGSGHARPRSKVTWVQPQLILRVFELGMKGKEPSRGWSRKGGLQPVTRSQNHEDASFPIYVTKGDLPYRARGVPKGA